MRCARCVPMMIVVALCLLAVGFFSSAEAATLSWTDNSTNELGFEVERKPGLCADTGTWAKIGEVGTDVKTYADTTTTTGYAYAYRVRAYNMTLIGGTVRQYSAYSNCAEIAYPLPGPVAPSGLTAQ